MTDALLTCRGFALEGALVPAFELMRGRIVTIQLPPRFESIEQLAAELAGLVRRPEIEIHGRAIVAERAEPPTGWRRWLSDPTPGGWLVRNGFTQMQAAAVLARHRIEDEFRLSQYAAGPRTVLGLEAAFRLKPEVVIFSTSGLDPRWELAVQDLVRSNLETTAAIYLAAPFLSNGALHRRSMSGETVVEVTRHLHATV